MVLRKPTPPSNLVPAPLSQAANNPPYPVTPSSEEPPVLPAAYHSPTSNPKTPNEAETNKDNDDGSDYSTSDWEQSDDEDTAPDDLPDLLRIGGGKPTPASANKNADSLPDILKAGPPPGIPTKASYERITPEPTGATAASWGGVSNSSGGSIPLQTNNPYLRMHNTGQSNFGGESSQQAWGDAPGQSQAYGELAELPSNEIPNTPTHHLANLTLENSVAPPTTNKYPGPPPVIAVESPTPQQTPQSVGSPPDDSNTSHWDPSMDISSIDAWNRSHGLPEDSNIPEAPPRTWQEQQAWDQGERERTQKELAAAHEAATRAEQERKHEEEFHHAEKTAQFTPSSSPFEEAHAPALPPRRSQEQEQEQPPAMPPRPRDAGAGSPSRPDVESPTTAINRRRKEHYPIKHIRWFDATTRQIRESPILTQNINGPCPLLALVNALVLSTPAGLKTEFVETLRTREQVSLGLLVDAVIEELMSGRRGTELGDVNDLYRFLIGLQTGLNVNPMFVHDPEAIDGPSSLDPFSAPQPGGFEKTRDMRLYKTFNVQLFHGWLPEPGSDAYLAFERVAKTYESSQYVQFQEEELDAKLQTEGLNADEQRLFTDIHAIKEFLNRWPTQLTDYGLRSMQEAIQPGQVGILFRNDHFSTLYKNPHTNELMTLVTDQGYSTHEEIVWESLVDVNGQGSDLYSGDFRAIGNNNLPQRPQQQQPVQSLLDIGDDQGWSTVSNNRRRNNEAGSTAPLQPPDSTPSADNAGLTRTEQEDHDLALALQLQEEEDDRHRRTVEERRRRENQLSEDAISTQGQSRPGNRRTPRQGENPPLIPPRRNNLPPQRPSNEPVPPPTYEEAATTPQYHPPQGHPANPNTPLLPQGPGMQASGPNIPPGGGGRRYPGRPMGTSPPLPARPGRRQSGVVGPHSPEERDKCVVM